MGLKTTEKEQTAGDAKIPASLSQLPTDLQLNVLSLLTPSSILEVRKTCSHLHLLSQELSLWTTIARSLIKTGSLPSLPVQEHEEASNPPSQETEQEDATLQLVKDLERVLLSAEMFNQSWDTLAAEPKKSLKLKAHQDRITCIKLLTAAPIWKNGKLKTRRWLVTGSVDGYVKVFDLSEMENHLEKEVSAHSPSNPKTGTRKSSSDSSAPRVPSLKRESGGLPSLGSPRSTSGPPSRRNRRPSCLIAEHDTGGDLNALDAELSEDCRSIRIATGSYYSSSGSSVYLLDLQSQPPMLDFRCSLDPPNWCGTQSVSIREDLVAVGTFTGLIHLFNWKTGWRGGIEREERSSTASVKLMGDFIFAVTRIGSVEVFSLPTPILPGEELGPTDEASLPPGQQYTLSQLPSTSLMSLSDSLPESSSRASGEVGIPKRKAQLLGKFAINEGNKPLRSISFGDTERRRNTGSRSGRTWEKELERRLEKISTNPRQSAPSEETEAVVEPLSFSVLDEGGLTHFVLDPSTSSTSLHPSFPYVWPPRMQSRQVIRGERPIGAASGASGSKGIVLTSLGGVPPICSARSFSTDRSTSSVIEDDEGANSSEDQSDSGSERSGGSTSSGSGFNQGKTHYWTSDLLIPIRPITTMGIPAKKSLEASNRRFSSSEISQRSPTLSNSDVSSRILPSAGGSAPLPSPSTSSRRPSFSSTSTSPSRSLPRNDSFSSNSNKVQSTSGHSIFQAPNLSSTSSFESGRVDIFTEQAFDDQGFICMGTARGVIYISDYSSL